MNELRLNISWHEPHVRDPTSENLFTGSFFFVRSMVPANFKIKTSKKYFRGATTPTGPNPKICSLKIF